MSTYLDCTLALLALINPMSKIFIVSTFLKTTEPKEIRRISIRASFIAAGVLILFVLVGNPLLKNIFHVDIYSFKIAGGIVLLFRGYLALNKGLFFEIDDKQRLADLSIVPLASPMIAGPATITAAVSFPAQYGLLITSASIVVAIIINLVGMLSAGRIIRVLTRYNLTGAFIRITGLIVATIGIQMILEGMAEYVHLIFMIQ